MQRDILAAGLGFGILCLCATEAFSQTAGNCGPRDRIVTMLSEKYKETRQSIGLAKNGRVMEVFASDETGTWTVTITMPTGTTCLVASGQAFEAVREDLEPAGTQS